MHASWVRTWACEPAEFGAAEDGCSAGPLPPMLRTLEKAPDAPLAAQRGKLARMLIWYKVPYLWPQSDAQEA